MAKAAAKTAIKKTTKTADPLSSFLSFMGKEDKVMDMLRMTDDDLLSNVKGYVSTQSLALNKAIGIPGYPRGRLIEISGPEHVGKSTLLDHLFAETQTDPDAITMLIDSEAGRDTNYTLKCGVDAKRLILPQPRKGGKEERYLTLEDVFNSVDLALDWQLKTSPQTLMVFGVDSVANLPSREDLERGAGERKPGEGAGILKHTFRVLSQKLAKSGAILVLVNQLYTRIGYQGWGDPRIEWGGAAIPYSASLRIRLNHGKEKIKLSDGTVIGSVTEARIQKSKVSANSYTKCQIPIRHGVGVDNVFTIFERFQREGYISNAGPWYSMIVPDMEPVKWQRGHLGLAEVLAQTPGLYEKLAAIYMAMPG
jgi:recombination protein RecA